MFSIPTQWIIQWIYIYITLYITSKLNKVSHEGFLGHTSILIETDHQSILIFVNHQKICIKHSKPMNVNDMTTDLWFSKTLIAILFVSVHCLTSVFV